MNQVLLSAPTLLNFAEQPMPRPKPNAKPKANPKPRDIRFGHDLTKIQNADGVDLALIRANLRLSVEERLLALEAQIRLADALDAARKKKP